MNTSTMTAGQQSSQLGKHHALRLAPAGHTRWLQVLDGSVWLTVTAPRGEASEDRTLAAGDSVELSPYDDAVVEGLTAARFQLVEPALALEPRAPWRAARAAPQTLHTWVRRLSLTAEPSSCF